MKILIIAASIYIGLFLAGCTDSNQEVLDEIGKTERRIMNYQFHLQEQITNLEKRVWRNEKVIKAHMEGG